ARADELARTKACIHDIRAAAAGSGGDERVESAGIDGLVAFAGGEGEGQDGSREKMKPLHEDGGTLARGHQAVNAISGRPDAPSKPRAIHAAVRPTTPPDDPWRARCDAVFPPGKTRSPRAPADGLPG